MQDLLFHFPVRYQDRTRVRPLAQLAHGDEAAVEVVVVDAQIAYGRRRTLRVQVEDAAGFGLTLRFFHFSAAQLPIFKPGACLRCFGEVRRGAAALEMVHPEYWPCDRTRGNADDALTPVYSITEGVSQKVLRALIQQALVMIDTGALVIPDGLPRPLAESQAVSTLRDALQFVHRPPVDVPPELLRARDAPAFRRLVLEELVAHQLGLRRLRASRRGLPAPGLDGGGDLRRALRGRLGFELTAAQERVVGEIASDLAGTTPMQRLLQGDVGSGKTVVAALAALQAVESGCQAALMAPTELLAEQHLRNISAWCGPLGVASTWLTGRHKGKERAAVLDALKSGDARVVVGTHALFQDDVVFHDLGLVLIDEQHRFGVHQRFRLREKGSQDGAAPHQLIMTATPIPRSLAMSIYADLDLSVIDELPPGRTPVSTVAVPMNRRDQVMERVRAACAEGRQAYWVCTLIEESEAVQCQAAEDTAQLLTDMLEDVRVGLLHGRMKAPEREPVMSAFVRGEIDLLVATTVIEVGVDVPNASLMVIENPERLGLAQLHQLRGRVGRGRVASHCVLLYQPPLSEAGRERLAVLRECNNGFEIAQKDLEMRGPGEVLGTRQTGELKLRIADPMRDAGMVPTAQHWADRILEEWPELCPILIDRWLGTRDEYARV